MNDGPTELKIQRLLNECEQALTLHEWERLGGLAQRVLRLDPDNGAALGFQRLARQSASASTQHRPVGFANPT